MSPYWWARLYLHKSTPVTQAMLERAATLQAEPERVALNRAIWRSFIEPEHDLRQVAKKINVPTLLIFGKKDPAIPPNKDGKVAVRTIPSARLVVLPCGHAAFAEVPALFLAELEPFLAACV